LTGAVPWFITAEIFNSNARGKASSIAVLVNWLANFIVTISFPFIEVCFILIFLLSPSVLTTINFRVQLEITAF
jgi:SP family facilitated glucose transporter-like MFS transporter 1